jgi:hypothetical protein
LTKTMILFYHDGEPWKNPTYRGGTQVVPFTEMETRACPWDLMKVVTCMKHRLCVTFEYPPDALSTQDLARLNTWKNRSYPIVFGRERPRIYLENARPDLSLAMCMALAVEGVLP